MTVLANAPLPAALVAILAASPAEPASARTTTLSKPMAGSTMFFADRHAAAYYSIDSDGFKTIITVTPGPDGKGHPMRFVKSLRDGESADYSFGGYDKNEIIVTLRVQRDGDVIKANVITDTPNAGL